MLTEKQRPNDFPLRLFPVLSQTLYLRCLAPARTDNIKITRRVRSKITSMYRKLLAVFKRSHAVGFIDMILIKASPREERYNYRS